MVRAVACEARGPEIDSSSDQKVYSLWLLLAFIGTLGVSFKLRQHLVYREGYTFEPFYFLPNIT